MSAPAPEPTPILEALIGDGELMNTLLTLIGPMLGIAIGVYALTFGWRLFRDVVKEPPMPTFARPQIEPRRTPAEAVVVKVTEPGPPKIACACPICRENPIMPTLEPPTLDDWEGWKHYGLIKEAGR